MTRAAHASASSSPRNYHTGKMMRNLLRFVSRPYVRIALLLLVLAGSIWLLPLRGRVLFLPETIQPMTVWPKIELDSAIPQSGQPLQITIQDAMALPHVQLAIDGLAVHPSKWEISERGAAPWEWTWQLDAPSSSAYDLIFYHHCDSGCIERARWTVGPLDEQRTASTPTKLGVVFANLERDWHGKSAWAESQQAAIQLILTELETHPDVASEYLRLMTVETLSDNSKWILGGTDGSIIDLGLGR